MSDFTPEEREGIVSAISHEPLLPEQLTQVPLRKPMNYGKVALSPIEGDKGQTLEKLTAKEMTHFENLQIPLEVSLGETRISLRKLAALAPGDLLPLETLCDDLVDIYAAGDRIGRGEIISAQGKFGVKIVTLLQ